MKTRSDAPANASSGVVAARHGPPLSIRALRARDHQADTHRYRRHVRRDPDYMNMQDLWVPKTSSTSRDQAIFVDRATDARLSSYAVLHKIDWFG